MPRRTRPRQLRAVLTLLPVLLTAGGASVAGGSPARLDGAGGAADGSGPVSRLAAADGPRAYMVQLGGSPSARTAAVARARGASRAAAASQARGQRRANDAAQADMAAAARAAGLVDRELFRVGTVYNGVAVITTPADAARLAGLDGVKAVVEIPEHERTNGNTAPYIGAHTAWTAAAGGRTGGGIKVAVIDTGIDYVHRNFGGRGTLGDLTAARDAANNPAQTDAAPSAFVAQNSAFPLFPTAKVVGGFDFVGDAYTGSTLSVPAPDPNPEDCPASLGGGHGSHVAGTLGGLGVKADGTTFAGGYDGLDLTSMKIGPGMAPGVQLYALRVFGCTGSTNLTVRAIEWAADPNGNGDTSDHLDVANLSLGSSFGAADDPSAAAATAASVAGVAMVISAGNSGDTTYVSGSPGSSPRALTVANMNAGETRDGFLLTAPTSGLTGVKAATQSVAFTWAGMAPVTGPLVYPDGANSTGCSAFTLGSLTGKVVLLDWKVPPATTFPCGSVVRAANAVAAGAIGVVMADPELTFTTSITGSAVIPAMFTNKPVQDELKAAIAAGGTVTVTFDDVYTASGRDTYAAGTLSASSSRGTTGGGGLKPDIAAPGTGIVSTGAGTGNGTSTLTGTSMAAPAVAGVMALLRQAHPTWSVEELKARAMNTAAPDIYSLPGPTGDRYGPQRVGAGTVQADIALEDDVVAYDAGSGGGVGAGFGAVEVPIGAPFQRDRTITVVNHGAGARSYTASYLAGTSVPGVAFEFPDGTAVSVPAGGTTTFRVRLKVADPSLLRNVRDPTTAATQVSVIRAYLAEAAGLVRLTAAGHPTLSVPAHASLRPVDALTSTRQAIGLPSGTGNASIPLTGTPVQTGSGATDFRSTITPLELQSTSPELSFPAGTPADDKGVDLKDVGVGSTGANIVFGVATWGRRASPGTSSGEIDVIIDGDQNGTPDYALYTQRQADSSTNPAGNTDVFKTFVYRYSTGSTFTSYAMPLSPAATVAGGGVFDSDVLTMQVPLATLGLTTGDPRFDYTVETYGSGVGPVDAAPKRSFDPTAAGLTFTANGSALADDVAGPLAFSYDVAKLTANGSTGALLLHHLGATGTRAEAIRIAANSLPVVATGGPYSVTEGQPANLDASGSTDADGDALAFAWDRNDDGTFETSGVAAPSLVLDDGPATRTVHVRVSDGVGAPVVADVPITVTNAAPTVTSVTATGAPADGLHLAASDPSAADAAAGYAFAVDVGADGSVDRTANGTQVDVAYPFPVVSTTVRVTATDKDGATSAPSDVVVTVAAVPPAPGPATEPPAVTPPATTPPVTTPVKVTSPPAKPCVVPSLKGKTLKQATAALKKARCALGKVTKPRRAKGTLVVASQLVKAKSTRKAGTKIGVRLQVKPKKKPAGH